MSSPAEQFWDGHYRQHQGNGNDHANPVLADVAGPLAPGTALDLGCGEGGDALWLAGRGWTVTAVTSRPPCWPGSPREPRRGA